MLVAERLTQVVNMRREKGNDVNEKREKYILFYS